MKSIGGGGEEVKFLCFGKVLVGEKGRSAGLIEFHRRRRRPEMRPPPDTAKASPEEERLRSLILSLQTESAILERLVYKNKNQHRRCPYFQALLKVRRDVRLLQSAGLGEILHVLIPIIDGRKPAQRAYVTMRLKRKHPSGKHNYQERLLGVARLLSQMAEPILKAAIQISFLLAKSFFTGFSVTILALLARLRVLVQQILLDIVSVFNKVSSLSQKKQSVKLIGEGIEAFREYYPSSGNAHHTLTLECVWEEDKFVLFERTNNMDIKKSDEDQGAVPLEASIQYETMDLFNEGDDSNKSLTSVQSSDEDMSSVKTQNDTARDLEPIDRDPSINLSTAESEMHGVVVEITHCEDERKTSVSKSVMDVGSAPRKKKAAFVSVSKPKLSDTNTNASNKKMKLDLLTNDANAMKTDDPFLSLLLGGCTSKNRLF